MFPRSRWPALVALLAVVACAPAPIAPAGRIVLGAPGAAAPIALPPAWTGRTLAATGVPARLTIEGPGLPAPWAFDFELAPGQAGIAPPDLPALPAAIVTLALLGPDGAPLARGALGAFGPVGPGAPVVLSETGAVAAEVARAIRAADLAAGEDVLAAVAPAALERALAAARRSLGLAHPALLDVAAFAAAVRTGGGAPPAPGPGLVRRPGRVIVRPTNWPIGLAAAVGLDDPSSADATLREGRPLVIEPVAPGTWTVVGTPALAGVAPLRAGVTVGPGETVEVAWALPAPAAGAALPLALAPAAAAGLPVGGADGLYVLGGTAYAAGSPTTRHVGSYVYQAATGWRAGPALPAPVVGAAAAVHGGAIYYLGGQAADGAVGAGGRLDPAGATAQAIAPMPEDGARAHASAATFGDLIYLAGGLAHETFELPPFPGDEEAEDPEGDGGLFPPFGVAAAPRPEVPSLHRGPAPAPRPFASPAPQASAPPPDGGEGTDGPADTYTIVTLPAGLRAYDPARDEWSEAALPPLDEPRLAMASAVVAGAWYLLGGASDEAGYSPYLASRWTPVGTGEALAPGTDDAWRRLAPMPTPRMGAAAVVVDGRIWVIGGVDARGVPSQAVEVYDPAADAWGARAPLATGRNRPAAALVDGQIVVAGGFAGFDPALSEASWFEVVPVATVEVITP